MSRNPIERRPEADALPGGGGLETVSEPEPVILPLTRGERDADRVEPAEAQPQPQPQSPTSPDPAQDQRPGAVSSSPTPAEAEPPRTERERALLSAVLERELALALAGRPLVSGAAEQLVRLWRDQFVVSEPEAGRFRVGTADGQPLAQAVDAWLARPEYAHFSRAAARGGTAAPGGMRTDPAGGPASPRTLGEALLQQWQQATLGLRGGLSSGLRRPR